jgi:hypothetical protein
MKSQDSLRYLNGIVGNGYDLPGNPPAYFILSNFLVIRSYSVAGLESGIVCILSTTGLLIKEPRNPSCALGGL